MERKDSRRRSAGAGRVIVFLQETGIGIVDTDRACARSGRVAGSCGCGTNEAATERRDGRCHRQSPGLLSRRVARACPLSRSGNHVPGCSRTRRSMNRNPSTPKMRRRRTSRRHAEREPCQRRAARTAQRRRAARWSSMKRAAKRALSARRSRSSLFMNGRMSSAGASVDAMPVPLQIVPCIRVWHALQRCGIAFAWCAARPPRGQAVASGSCTLRACGPPQQGVRPFRRGWHATRLIVVREVRSNLHHLQDR